MRRFIAVAAFAILCHWQTVYAQTVTVPEESPAYTVISPVVTHDLPEGAKVKYRWSATDGISFGEGTQDNKKPFYTGRPGPYTLTLTAVWIEGDSPQLGVATAAGRIGPAGPEPPPPPVKTLAEHAGKDAVALGQIYAALLKDFNAQPNGGYDDVAHFQRTHASVLSQRGLEKNGAAAEIAKRLAVDSLEKLKAALEGIVKELGSSPTPPGPTDPATAATYVYEKDNGGIPPAVHAGLSELNTAMLRATTFEEDTKDSSGAVPDQYKVALTAAQQAGLPALVVTAGEKVVRVVKAPTTREQVLEAVKP